jgi:hypothetical protein
MDDETKALLREIRDDLKFLKALHLITMSKDDRQMVQQEVKFSRDEILKINIDRLFLLDLIGPLDTPEVEPSPP